MYKKNDRAKSDKTRDNTKDLSCTCFDPGTTLTNGLESKNRSSEANEARNAPKMECHFYVEAPSLTNIQRNTITTVTNTNR